MSTFMDALGFTAGVMLAASILPQISRVMNRGSAEDLAYTWKFTTGTGLSFQLVYLYHNGMWAVFYPLSCELAFIIYLAGIKTYYKWSPVEKRLSGGAEWSSVDDTASTYGSSGNGDSSVDVGEDSRSDRDGPGDADGDVGSVDTGGSEESAGGLVDYPLATGGAVEV